MEDFLGTSLSGWVGALIDATATIVGAFIGAFAAIVGAAGAVAVAWWVLRRTLRHERELLAEQLAREREQSLEATRLAAFARLSEELITMTDRLGTTPRSVYQAMLPAVTAWHGWATYMPINHPLVLGVNRGIGEVRRKALRATDEAGQSGPGAVDARFETLDGYADVGWTVTKARRWHQAEDERPTIEDAFVNRFPLRSSTDLDTGEDFLT